MKQIYQRIMMLFLQNVNNEENQRHYIKELQDKYSP